MSKIKHFDYDGEYKNEYYDRAYKDNKTFRKDYRYKEILNFLKKTDKICEFGCGDASRVRNFKKNVSEIWGFDVSKEAIKRARKNLPSGNFLISDSGKELKNEQFDVTLCMFTLEHVFNPKKFLSEMVRVTKKGGLIINLCPNFGSPLCPSPPEIVDCNFFERIMLVLKRIKNYRKYYKNKIYKNVPPLDRKWQPDFDTTSEVSLEAIVRRYKSKIIHADSFWSFKPYIYIPFAILAFLKIYPFQYWGFNCFFVIRK